MEFFPPYWNWFVCFLLPAVSVVRCQCPDDVLQKAQLCTANLGVGPPTAGPNRFVLMGEVEKAKLACSEGLFRQSLSCLRELTDACQGNTEREHILRMMVDPQKSQKGVDYFCQNIHIYELNADCIQDSHDEVSNCTREVSKNFKTKAMATVNMDVMMTSTCRFYYTGLSCSNQVVQQTCGSSAVSIIQTILEGFQPPKCKDFKFDDFTYTVVNDGTNGSSYFDVSNLLLCLCALTSFVW